MADPIPYVVRGGGSAGSAPDGSIPIDLYGAGGGGGGAVSSVNGEVGDVRLGVADIPGLTAALGGKVDDSEFAAYQTAATQAFGGLESALDVQRQNLENTTSTANSAVQPSNPRLPIVITRAAYDALNPPAPGQAYFIQG